MIEIRELVIRATVEDSNQNNEGRTGRVVNSDNTEKKGCSSETIELMLQIMNDKKER